MARAPPVASAFHFKGYNVMKTSVFRSLVAMALMACAAFATTCYEAVVAPVVAAYKVVKRCLASWFTSVLALVNVKAGLDLNPVSIFASAKAFYLRLVRRQRPHVTTGWRMCPSG